MKHTVLNGTIIAAYYRGYVSTSDGIRVTAVLPDGTEIAIDHLNTGGKIVDVPATHDATFLPDKSNPQIVKIERRA